MIDLHVHSTCSGDAVASIDEMCRRAVKVGISQIAFTEHLDNNPVDLCYGAFNLGRYLREIEAAREKFGDRLTILTGAEFGEPHLYQDELSKLKYWKPDVILGSVHWVGETLVAVDAFHAADMEKLYVSYFDEVLKTVEAGGFDVLAHFDLVKRFGVQYAGAFELERFNDQIAVILTTMIEQGIAMEVNTSGLRQPCAEPFPSLEILELYKDIGGELVTIGSDSHSVSQLGFGLKEGMAMIRSAGFNSITLFENREMKVFSSEAL